MAVSIRALALAALAAAALPARGGEAVACHVDYGGETHVFLATPVDSPYAVKVDAVGSHFLFRVVFRTRPADLAAIKVYAYTDRDAGPALVHQGTWPYPPPAAAVYGFSGRQSVHEPQRDSELRYWCELKNTP